MHGEEGHSKLGTPAVAGEVFQSKGEESGGQADIGELAEGLGEAAGPLACLRQEWCHYPRHRSARRGPERLVAVSKFP